MCLKSRNLQTLAPKSNLSIRWSELFSFVSLSCTGAPFCFKSWSHHCKQCHRTWPNSSHSDWKIDFQIQISMKYYCGRIFIDLRVWLTPKLVPKRCGFVCRISMGCGISFLGYVPNQHSLSDFCFCLISSHSRTGTRSVFEIFSKSQFGIMFGNETHMSGTKKNQLHQCINSIKNSTWSNCFALLSVKSWLKIIIKSRHRLEIIISCTYGYDSQYCVSKSFSIIEM